MIEKNYIDYINNNFTETEAESIAISLITSVVRNGDNVFLYQGDEPIKDLPVIVESPDWLSLEQSLFYSGLRQKAKESPNLNHFEFASLIGAFGNGKIGLASENTLIYLLHAINADWDSDDIMLLNQLLEACNFTVRYV